MNMGREKNMPNANHQEILKRIEQLKHIGTALSVEQDLPLLLEMILLGAKELTNADGGSLYILDGDFLRFELIHTTSLGFHMGGTSNCPISFLPIALYDAEGKPNMRMVVTRAAIEGQTVNIPDAYASEDFDFSGTREFDDKTGYLSTSLLAVPMQDHENQIIGVLQLINSTDAETNEVKPFNAEDESLVTALTSQAAIALNRKGLIDGLEELLQSLVKLIANAIDDKSPHTAGHCRRVPFITMSLARAVNADDGQVFGETSFSQKELEELELAAWLHDCGKITTPDYVVDKQTRLETIFDRIELIDVRIEILRRDIEIARLRRLLGDEGDTADEVMSLDGLTEMQVFLRQCNSAGFVDDQMREKIAEYGRHAYQVYGQELPQPFLTEDEIYNLSVAKGTLTDEERKVINNHIEATIRMLSVLPFPKQISRVPEIAGGHHERMDGRGYPQQTPAGELSIQARMLAIADVFEALTASDRMYREPNTLFDALGIMAFMCKDGHFDPNLFKLFLTQEVYLDYARNTLQPAQIDDVDIDKILPIFNS